MEQRTVIKFHEKLDKNASERFWLIQQVYGDNCLSRANVFLWHKHFLNGSERLRDNNREGRLISAMHITFFDSKEIIHREFVPTDQTITGAYFFGILRRLMARICRIRSENRDPEIWSLLHDNAPSHTSLIVRQFLARNQVYVLNHLPYSPDLAPCNFSLFPKLKLKGCFFKDISTIKTVTTRALEAIPQNELEHAFELLLNHCNKCIETGGEYFE